MNTIGKIVLLVTIIFSTSGCGENHEKHQKACYWMENYSGNFEWVLAEDIYKKVLTKEECFQLDSCDGGKGLSGGGCYKWASSAIADRESWN